MVLRQCDAVITPGVRPARDVPDDSVLPFQVESLDVRGRIVRLGPILDEFLARHDYPKPVSTLLAEAVGLTLLVGTALKFEGRFILQTQGDGPVAMLVVDFETPNKLRACARFDRSAVDTAIRSGHTSAADLLGRGHLAMTIDRGPDMQRYQGLVELDGTSLEAAAHTYFQRSEQIPSFVRLAVAESVTASDGTYRSQWRAGGMLLQFLPESPERRRMADLPPGDTPPDWVPLVHREDDSWVTARTLAETLGSDELVDPSSSPEQLLYHLFHEQGVRVFTPMMVETHCRCSQSRIADMLRSFTADERADMTVDGRITVTCEFCSQSFGFAADAVAT
jgi:molecular chaperone Hsp33